MLRRPDSSTFQVFFQVIPSDPEILTFYWDFGNGFTSNLEEPQTAYTTIEDKDKAISAGCNDFISKPIEEENLKAWTRFFQYWGSSKQIVGDDLTVTNPDIIEKLSMRYHDCLAFYRFQKTHELFDLERLTIDKVKSEKHRHA